MKNKEFIPTFKLFVWLDNICPENTLEIECKSVKAVINALYRSLNDSSVHGLTFQYFSPDGKEDCLNSSSKPVFLYDVNNNLIDNDD